MASGLLLAAACGPAADSSASGAKTVSGNGNVVGTSEMGVAHQWAFDACRGASATEGNDTVTVRGAARWSLGRRGCALDFDGADAMADVGSPAVVTAGSYTVSAWVSLSDASHASTLLSVPGQFTSGVALRYVGSDAAGQPGGMSLAVAAVDTAALAPNELLSNMALPAGRWVHVAASWDAATQRAQLFVDGVPAGAGPLPKAVDANANMVLGAEWQAGAWTRYFSGRIDEVAVVPQVMAPADVAAMAQALPVATPSRAPATPLLVRDPYLSSWLAKDAGAMDFPRFWTGAYRGMDLLLRVDGASYHVLGAAPGTAKRVATETYREVTPTQTRQTLEAGGVALHLLWGADLDPNSPQRLSVPLGTLSAQVQAKDGQAHAVSLYADVSGEWANGNVAAPIGWSLAQNTVAGAPFAAWHVAASAPVTLSELNDAPTWGEQWFAASGPNMRYQSAADVDLRTSFAAGQPLMNTSDTAQPRAINKQWPVFAFSFDFAALTGAISPPATMTLGHVRDPGMTYGGTQLPPLWKTYFPDAISMVKATHQSALDNTMRLRNDGIDRKIWADAVRIGGPSYASLCALAVRQAFGGLQFVSRNGDLWLFLKEISSDGNVSTVDVMYPGMPLFLYLQPQMLRWMLTPVFTYAESGNWPQAFAPHDLGASFPNASLHTDGGGENMPVEESANMILMTAAYAKLAGDANALQYAGAHYPVMAQWANFLVANTLDPNLQNQTDDFTGMIAHSSNLALKGIVALGAMGQLAQSLGKTSDAARFLATANNYIGKWATYSMSADRTHLKLAYDVDASWSQKYNIFPDRLLGLRLVSDAIDQMEANYYRTKMMTYGLPLDQRHTYTKLDWSLWTAAGIDDAELRQALIEANYRYANETSSRVPLSDWYDTQTANSVGFIARPVVGGVFALMARARAGTL